MAPDIGAAVVQQLDEVSESEGEQQVLNTDFTSMKGLLALIYNQFQSRQKRFPEPVERCLVRIRDALVDAQTLLDASKKQQKRGCGLLFCNSDLPSKIRIWKVRFDALSLELEMVFSISSNAEQIVSSTAPRAQRLLQPVPDSGFVGAGIKSARQKLQGWLGEARREARVIGVYGKGGVGKTSLLKIIYNTYKKEVSRFFDLVIWFTVCGNFEIEQLQASIAEALNLSLEENANAETKKMKLSASLERKKLLLILDNIWKEIDLSEVGVRIGEDTGSKLLISSRSREVIENMGAKDCFLEIEPLSSDEGWDLFRLRAFENGIVPENDIIKARAREIASDCRGLPLAINAVAGAMSFKKIEDYWDIALNSMRRKDASVPANHRTIDAELYQVLRWTYNELSNSHLKIFFLNCAAFLEDKEIVVETLVQMWDAEGLLKKSGTPSLMDAGRQCIDELVRRCLVERVEYIADEDYHSVEYLKIHEVFRDMAIDIGQKEENCLFAAGQQLQNFPTEKVSMNCRRISVGYNAIHDLPNNLRCSELRSLVLASNVRLEKVHEIFFNNVLSLQVLDLSSTSIKELPNLNQLQQLQFLNLSSCSKLVDLHDSLCSVLSLKGLDLSYTSIKSLPKNFCNLSSLQVLNLNSCLELHELPTNIEGLRNLKHLKLGACLSLEKVPENLSQLTSLNTLILPLMESTCAMSVEDLSKLSNLMELTTVVKSETALATMDEMRSLTLECDNDVDAGAAPERRILENIGNMKKLQDFHFINYQQATLPDSICKLQNIRVLFLRSCYQLEALPTLEETQSETAGESALDETKSESAGASALEETRSESAGDFFPVLEKLFLRNLLRLNSLIAGSSREWNEGTMSRLQLLVIVNCPLLERFPKGMKLPKLKELQITMCNQLMELDIGSGNYPLLESLTLDELNTLESIAGSSSSGWNESTLSELHIVEFVDCPSLKKLPNGMEKLSQLKQINGEYEWWQRLTWENNEMKTSLSRLFMII